MSAPTTPVTYTPLQRLVTVDNDYSENAVGVRAKTVISIPYGDGAVMQIITSPGLWGVEMGDTITSEDEDYLNEVYEAEEEILLAMLAALGAVPAGSEQA